MAKVQLVRRKKAPSQKIHLHERIVLSEPFLQLRDLERKCRQLVAYMNQPVMITDDQERAIYANRKLCELIEYPAHEILGRYSYDFCTPKTASLIRKVVSQDRKRGVTSTYEVEFLTKSGNAIPVSVNGMPLPDGGTVGIFSDLRPLRAKEEEARLQHLHFKQLFQNEANAIVALDLEQRVLNVNPAFTAFFGYTLEEILGKNINDIIVPQGLKKEGKLFSRQANSGMKFFAETLRQNKDGALLPVAITSVPIIIDGKQTGIYAIYRDIGKRKQAEEALHQSEERYALAMRAANDGLWDWNIKTNKKYYSARFKEILGYKEDEISDEELQKKFPTFLTPQERKRMAAATQAHLKDQIPYDLEYEVTLESGKNLWLRSLAQAIWDERKKPIRMVGSIRDVTRRKEAETALAFSQKLLDDILQGSPVATYVIGMDHHIVYWNRAAELLTGRKASAMIGTDKHWEVFYDRPRPMIIDHMVDGLSPDAIIKKHYSYTNFHKSKFENGVIGDVYFPGFHGGGKWLRFNIKPLYDMEGRPIGAIESIEDIHQLKHAEEQLRRFNEELKSRIAEKTRTLREANRRLKTLNALKDEFIAVTSHELRSPLTAVRGYLSFLNDPDVFRTLPESARDYLRRAYNNVEVLNNLVNNILDVSRLESGRLELKKTPVDLEHLIRAMIDNFTVSAQEKKLRIVFHNRSKQDPCIIMADTIRIHQVLVNVLDNAIKYSKTGKTIRVELAADQTHARLSITDQGIGIPKTQIPKLFSKFIRATNVVSRYQGGAGLGLFITKKIVELHGGTIHVESRQNHWTTFKVQLPLA